MNVFLNEACYHDEKGKMRMKTKTNFAGHSIFLSELPSNYVNVENSNKCPFLKVEEWALIRGVGAYSRGGRLFEGWALFREGRLFNNFTSRVGTFSRGCLLEGGGLFEALRYTDS